MSEPIQGSRLHPRVQARILHWYVNRWTHENMASIPEQYRPTIAPVSDAEWLQTHAFYITIDGELDRRYQHCEPYYGPRSRPADAPIPDANLAMPLYANEVGRERHTKGRAANV